MKEPAGDWGAKTAKAAQSETKTPHRLTGEERREKSTQKGASLVAQCLGPLGPKAGGPGFNPWSGNEDPTCQMSHRLQRKSQISCAAAKTQGSQINNKKKKKKKKKGRKEGRRVQRGTKKQREVTRQTPKGQFQSLPNPSPTGPPGTKRTAAAGNRGSRQNPTFPAS